MEEEIENLRLDGDVERSSWLIGDYQSRLHDQRHRYQHALPHSAGELMRILLRSLFRGGNSCERQRLDGAIPGFSSADAGMDPGDLRDLVSNGENRIERGHRLLEDHRDAVATN